LIYQEGCKALTMPFKMKSNRTVIYTTELQAKSNKMGWGVGSQQITKFVNSVGNIINIIDQYGPIDIAVLQARCKSFCKLGGPCFNQRVRQNNKMMAECIMPSLSVSARIRLLPFRGNFEFNSVVFALLLHKKVMALATIDSVATTKILCSNLREIPTYCATVKGNIELLHTYFDNNHSQIIARSSSVDDPIDVLSSAYAVVPCFEFRTYIKQKQDNCTDGSLKLTHKELILLATNKYNLLVQEGKWGTISPDEEKIIAMQAELTALKGQFTLTPNLKKAAGKKPGDKKNDGDKPTPPKGKKKNKKNTANKLQQKQDEKWRKTAPPKDGEPHAKSHNGRRFHWCKHHMARRNHLEKECCMGQECTQQQKPNANPQATAAVVSQSNWASLIANMECNMADE
jgi:hypothetical protein